MVMILPTCAYCGGPLGRSSERHARETIQHDLACRDCGAGGTVVCDPQSRAVVRRVGPAVDRGAARQRRRRERLVADGGELAEQVEPRGPAGEAIVAIEREGWDRALSALNQARDAIRKKRRMSMSTDKCLPSEALKQIGDADEREKIAAGESLAGGSGRVETSNDDCKLSYRVKRQKCTEAYRQQYDERVPSAGWRAVSRAMAPRSGGYRHD